MQQSNEIRELTLALYRAMSSGDADAINRMLSREPGLTTIGTDPKEWWTGYETTAQVFAAQMREAGGAFPIAGGDPQAWSEGTVGWAADRAAFAFPGSTPIPFRLTTVWRRERGEWKLVQFHSSIGIANEETVGKELTV
ncbi:MAG: nuclear transport factor 2 family protein [Chloroflexi bacterium]|nr:nuclear transport factor 2 family protein [Chloroflexota bacterium]